MSLLKTAALSFGIMVLFGSVAVAFAQSPDTTSSKTTTTNHGDAVRNKTGEKVGSITDIMIDLPSGRVAYAVLSFGGFLGFGEKLFAIPWEALTLDEDNKWFILDVDKGSLENAPGFDEDNWPDMADASWGTDIHNYYGQKPYWEKYPESYGMDSEAPAPVATGEIGTQASREYDRNAKKL